MSWVRWRGAISRESAAQQSSVGFQRLLAPLYEKDWVVYCKPPLGGPHHTLAYLGRYAHRVALSNERLLGVEDDQVTFRYRDQKDHDRVKPMTLDALGTESRNIKLR